MVVLAMFFASIALAGSSHSYEFKSAEHATGVAVVCLTPHDFRAWGDDMNPTWDAFWDFRARAVVLGMGLCDTMKRWHSVESDDLENALITLGHEYRHSQQHGGNPPFSENGPDDYDADCWADHHFRQIARKMGIHRRMPVVLDRVPGGC